MAHEFNDLKGFLFLVLIYIPRTLSTSIDCGGKPFHCLNSTHFMICVDLGGGVSSTIDDFIIPCPPTTVCQKDNRFECEFPIIEEPVSPVDIIVASKDNDKMVSIDNGFTTIIPEETTKTFLLPEEAITVLPVIEKTNFSLNNEILENLKDEFTGGNEKYFDADILTLTNAMNVKNSTGGINHELTVNKIENEQVNISKTNISVSNDTSTLNEVLISNNNETDNKLSTVKEVDSNQDESGLTTLSPNFNVEKSYDLDQPVNRSVSQSAQYHRTQNLYKPISASVTDVIDDALITTEAIVATTSAYSDANENGNNNMTTEPVMNNSFALKVNSVDTNYNTKPSTVSVKKDYDYIDTLESVTASQIDITNYHTENLVTELPILEETTIDAGLLILNIHDTDNNLNKTYQNSPNDNNELNLTADTFMEITTLQPNFITEETYSIKQVQRNLSEQVNASLQRIKSDMTIDVTTVTVPIVGAAFNHDSFANVYNVTAVSFKDNSLVSFKTNSTVTDNLIDVLNIEDITTTLEPTVSTSEITSRSYPKEISKIELPASRDTATSSDGLSINTQYTKTKLNETNQVDHRTNLVLNQTTHMIPKMNRFLEFSTDKSYTTNQFLVNKDDLAPVRDVYSQATTQAILSNETLDVIGTTEPHFITTAKYNDSDNYIHVAFWDKLNNSTILKVNNDVPKYNKTFDESVETYNETVNIFEPDTVSPMEVNSASNPSKLNITKLNATFTEDFMLTDKHYTLQPNKATNNVLEERLEITTVTTTTTTTTTKLNETNQVDHRTNLVLNQTTHMIPKINMFLEFSTDKSYTTNHVLVNKDDLAPVQDVYSQATTQALLSNETLDVIGTTEKHFVTTAKYNDSDNYVLVAFSDKLNNSTILKVNNDVPKFVKTFDESSEPDTVSPMEVNSASISSKLNITKLNTPSTEDFMLTNQHYASQQNKATNNLLEERLEVTTVLPKPSIIKDTENEAVVQIFENPNLKKTTENTTEMDSTTIATAESVLLNEKNNSANNGIEYVTEKLKNNGKNNDTGETDYFTTFTYDMIFHDSSNLTEVLLKNASMTASTIEYETQATSESTLATEPNNLMSNFTKHTVVITNNPENNLNYELHSKKPSNVEITTVATHGLNDSETDNDNETFTKHLLYSQISKIETTTFQTTIKDREEIFINESPIITTTNKQLIRDGDHLKNDHELSKQSIPKNSINEETTTIAQTREDSIYVIPEIVSDTNETVLNNEPFIQDELNQTARETYLPNNLQVKSNLSLSVRTANNFDITNKVTLNVTHLTPLKTVFNYSNSSSSDDIVARTESGVVSTETEGSTFIDKDYKILRDSQNKTAAALAMSVNNILNNTIVNQNYSNNGDADHVNVSSNVLKQITKPVILITANMTSTENGITSVPSPSIVKSSIGKGIVEPSITFTKNLSSSTLRPMTDEIGIEDDNKPLYLNLQVVGSQTVSTGNDIKNILTEQSGMSLTPFKDADLNLRNESTTNIIETAKQNTITTLNNEVFESVTDIDSSSNPSTEIPLVTSQPSYPESNLGGFGENNKQSEPSIDAISLKIVDSTQYPLLEPLKKIDQSNSNITLLATDYVEVPLLPSVNERNNIAASHNDITVLQSTYGDEMSPLSTPKEASTKGINQILPSTVKLFSKPDIMTVQTEVISENVTQISYLVTDLDTILTPSKTSIQNQTNVMMEHVSVTVPVTENNDYINIGKNIVSPQSVRKLIINDPDPSKLITATETTSEKQVIGTANAVLQSTTSPGSRLNVSNVSENKIELVNTTATEDQKSSTDSVNTAMLILKTAPKLQKNNSVSQILPLKSRISSINVVKDVKQTVGLDNIESTKQTLNTNYDTINDTLWTQNVTTSVRQNIAAQIQPEINVLIGEEKIEDLVQNHFKMLAANVTQNKEGIVSLSILPTTAKPIHKKAIVNQVPQVELFSDTKTENSLSTQKAVYSDSDDILAIQTPAKDIIKSDTILPSKDNLTKAVTQIPTSHTNNQQFALTVGLDDIQSTKQTLNTNNDTLWTQNVTTSVRRNIAAQIQPEIMVLIEQEKIEDLVQNHPKMLVANVTQDKEKNVSLSILPTTTKPINKKAIVNQVPQVELISETKTENSVSTQKAVYSDSDDKLAIQTPGKDVIKSGTILPSKDNLGKVVTQIISSNKTQNINQTPAYYKENTGPSFSINTSTTVRRSAIKPNIILYGGTSALEQQSLDTVADEAVETVSSNITKDVHQNLNDSSSLTSTILPTESATMVENINVTHKIVQPTILSDKIVRDTLLNNVEAESEKFKEGAEKVTNLVELKNTTINHASSDFNKREEINLNYINDTTADSQINIEISVLGSHNETSEENNSDSAPKMTDTSSKPAYNHSVYYKSQLNGMKTENAIASQKSSVLTQLTTYLNNSGYVSSFKNGSINSLLLNKEHIAPGNITAINIIRAKVNNITAQKKLLSGQQIQSNNGSAQSPKNVSDGFKLASNIINKLNTSLTSGIAKRTISANKVSNTTFSIDCFKVPRGKYADSRDCRKFYICLGKLNPIVGRCPNNTVFSEINKQCTRNLSHCVRNNQFHCLYEGRFSDVLRDNIYYICVKNNLHGFYRYKLQCQDGYRLNKSTVKCEKNIEEYSQSGVSLSINSNDSNIKKSIASDNSENNEFECKKLGKFPIPNDCRRYYVCTKTSKDEYRRKIKKCSKDEVYDKKKKKCVPADSEEC